MNARAAVAGPAFLARTGLRAAGRDTLVTAAVVAATAFLLAAAPLWFEHAADGVLRSRLAAATEAQRGLEFELRGSLPPSTSDPLAAVAAQAGALTADLPASIAGAVAPPETLVDTPELLAVDAPRPILRVGLRIEDVAGAVHWVSGRAPTGRTTTIEVPDRQTQAGSPAWANVYEAAISTGTAEVTGLGTGDRLVTVPATNMAGFAVIDVVGVFAVDDPAAGRWFADGTLGTAIAQRVSQEVTIYHAVALVDPGAYPALLGAIPTPGTLPLQLRYRWRYRLDPARVPTAALDTFAFDLARLRAAHPFAGAPGTPGLSTGLADLVDRYRVDRSQAATAVALAMVGPLAAMLGALLLVAVATATRRRTAVQVVRTRGGGVAQVVAGRAVEALVVTVPAAFGGAALASLAVTGGWVDGALVPAIAVGLVAAVLAAIPAGIAARRPPVAREVGPGGRSGRRRAVFDLLVVAIALGGVASLRGRDAPMTDGLNLFLAAVPVLLALAGGVVVLRLYPAVVRVGARAAAAGRGLVLVHGLRAVERGAAGQQAALVALVLTVAIGIFSAAVVGTVGRDEERAAAEQVGADFRLEGRAGATLPATFDIATVPGLAATAQAARTDGSLAGTSRVAAPVSVVALDVPRWDAVVAGLPIGDPVPASLRAPVQAGAGAPERPIPAIVGGDTLARLGLGPGQVAPLTVGGRTVSIRVAAAPAAFPGLGPVGTTVILDLAAARAAFPDAVLDPAIAFIRAPASAASGLQAVVDRYGVVVTLAERAAVLADLRSAPLAGAIRDGFGAALLIAVLYAAAIVAVATRQAIVARRRELGVLHALGLAPGRLRDLLLVEVAPLVGTALVAGGALGLAIAWLVIPDLDLGRLAGLAGPVEPGADLALLAAIATAPVLGAALAVLVGARGAGNADLAAATRAVDP